MLVKCKFLDENGALKGKAYTYSAFDDLVVGELATTPEGKKVSIIEVDVSPESIKGFEDKIKGVLRVIEDETDSGATEFDKQELIVIEQLPVIKEKLKLISDEIDKRIAVAKSLPVTDETVKTVKAMRAQLNKEFAALEERRKAVKKEVLMPYETFEEIYKQFVSDKYKAGDSDLKTEIDRVENARKAEKSAEIEEYFKEYAESKHIDIVTWEKAGIKVGLSDSISSLKSRAREVIDRIESELQLIETQEHKEEILVDYKQHLNVSMAITTVTARHKAIEDQKKRQAEIDEKKSAEQKAVKLVEAVTAPLAPPIVKKPADDPVRVLVFKVTAPISKLRELKGFLDDGGYQYE